MTNIYLIIKTVVHFRWKAIAGQAAANCRTARKVLKVELRQAMEHRRRNQRQNDQHQIHQNIHTKIKQIIRTN